MPKFVADSYDTLPPTSGFEVIADYILKLFDEMTTLKSEIGQLKDSRMQDGNIQNDITIMKEDILIMKGEMRKLNHKIMGDDIRRSSMIMDRINLSMGNDLCKVRDIGNSDSNILKNSNITVDNGSVSLDINDKENLILGAEAAITDAMFKGLINNGKENSYSPSAPPVSQESCQNQTRSSFGILGTKPKSKGFSYYDYEEKEEHNTSIEELNHDLFNDGYKISGNKILDKDGYELSMNKKRKKNIIGTKKTSETGITIKGVVKKADLYVGNCDLNVNSEAIKEYIYKECKISIESCEELKSRNPSSKSFKVTLNIKDRNKLLSSDVWPEDIICRKFFSPRNNR